MGGMVSISPIPEAVAVWVERSTAAQGVPMKVTDPKAVEAVAALLKDGREPAPVRAARSE